MPDDERKREALGRSRIHLCKDQIRYWTDKLGIQGAAGGRCPRNRLLSGCCGAQLRRMALDSGEKR